MLDSEFKSNLKFANNIRQVKGAAQRPGPLGGR